MGFFLLPPVPIPSGTMVEVKAGRIAVMGRPCATQFVESRIRPPCVRVKLQHDAFACRGPNEGGVYIPAFDLRGKRLKLCIFRLTKGLGQCRFVGTHRDQMAEVVPAKHVHVHAHRPQPMGGVEVAISLQMLAQPPTVVVVGGIQQQRPQVMQVGALGVGHIPKNTFFHHVEQPKLFAVVAAILQHDAVLLGAL